METINRYGEVAVDITDTNLKITSQVDRFDNKFGSDSCPNRISVMR